MLLLLLACAAEPRPAGPDPGDPGDGAVDSAAPDTPPADTAALDSADSAEPWPDDEVDWQPTVTLVYDGAVLPDGAALAVETAPAGLDEATTLTFTLTNRSAADLSLSADPVDWLSGDGFTWAAAPPTLLHPEESVTFGLSVNPLDAIAAETRAATLTIPADGGPTITLQATIPRPLRLVAAADGPTLLYSDDYGATWVAAVTPATIDHRVHALTWGEGRFFLAAQEGFSWSVAGTYQWSADGQTWTDSAVSDDFWVSDCAYGLDRFFCVRSDTISWSETGETVLHEATHWAAMLNTVLFTGDRFWAGGRSGRLVSSTDGSAWQTDTTLMGGEYISDLAEDGHGTLVAAGGWSGHRYITATSTDGGATWTDTTFCADTWTRLESVAYGDGLWLVGGVSNLCDSVYASTDALHWSPVSDVSVTLLGFANGWFFGGQSPWGGSPSLLRSRDGVDWETVATAPAGATFRAIAIEGR